jgi:hypothetical protein
MQLKRRDLITLLGSAVAAWPLAARAQQAGKLPTIGFLGADASAWSAWTAAFVERLRQLGWIEGRTIAIEYRWSEGRPERIAEVAAEFVRLNVDAIVTNDSSAPAIKQATSVIPIVFVLGNDPVGTGLVASLARPGGNITGLSVQQSETDSKRLELLREVVPRLRRVAVMANVGNPTPARQMRGIESAARALGLEVVPLEIRRAEDIAPAFAALNAQADALYIVRLHIRPRAICLRCCELTVPVSTKRGEPCYMSCSPPQATSASPIASCISPWLRSVRRIERTQPRPSVRCSTKRRQSSPALACGFGSQCVRHPVSGLPSPARRSSAPPRRPLPRFPDQRRNRTFLRYTMSGGLNLVPKL